MDKIKHLVYVTLDSLLDTRLALIAQAAPDAVGDILSSGAWHQRLYADPRRVDKRLVDLDWETLWGERTADILPMAGMTYVPSTIRRLAEEYDIVGPRMGMEGSLHLTINVYPYVLTDEEKEHFRNVFKVHYGCTDVQIAYYAVEHFTKSTLDAYDTVILDDLDAWHSCHGQELGPGGLSRTKVNAPLLLTRDAPPMPPEMLARASAMAFQDIFVLELVPAKEFSLIAQDDVDIKDDTPPPA